VPPQILIYILSVVYFNTVLNVTIYNHLTGVYIKWLYIVVFKTVLKYTIDI